MLFCFHLVFGCALCIGHCYLFVEIFNCLRKLCVQSICLLTRGSPCNNKNCGYNILFTFYCMYPNSTSWKQVDSWLELFQSLPSDMGKSFVSLCTIGALLFYISHHPKLQIFQNKIYFTSDRVFTNTFDFATAVYIFEFDIIECCLFYFILIWSGVYICMHLHYRKWNMQKCRDSFFASCSS